jgi:hypothetical protein
MHSKSQKNTSWLVMRKKWEQLHKTFVTMIWPKSKVSVKFKFGDPDFPSVHNSMW